MMAFSTEPLNQPIGLQRLSELQSLDVHWKRTWIGNKYEFRESSGELLFNVKEESRNLFTGCGFNMILLDANNEEVIQLRRPNSYCYSKVEVSLQGALASIVRQKRTWVTPVLELHDANDVPVYRLKGPRLQNANFEFQLTNLDKVPLGTITKQWAGWRKELLGENNKIIITFPKNLEIKYKAACIAASVFIIHERRRQNR